MIEIVNSTTYTWSVAFIEKEMDNPFTHPLTSAHAFTAQVQLCYYNIFYRHLDLPLAEFLRLQRNETFENVTSSGVIAVFV